MTDIGRTRKYNVHVMKLVKQVAKYKVIVEFKEDGEFEAK